MAGILDTVRNAVAMGTPGYGQVSKALDNAASSQSSAALKSYQDKYGPNVGQRIYQEDQAKAAAAAQPSGQGHMGDWADKMHPRK